MILLVRSKSDRFTGWRYFWMKRVTGFSPREHCARCLVGTYEKRVGTSLAVNVPHGLDGYAPGDIVYLCGVSAPYRWANNLHLAGIVEPGASATVTAFTGDVVSIDGLRAIPFDDRRARELYPNLANAFLTCRNFQFGATLFT